MRDKKEQKKDLTEELIADALSDKNFDSPIIRAMEQRLNIMDDRLRILQNNFLEQQMDMGSFGNLASWLAQADTHRTSMPAFDDEDEESGKGKSDKTLKHEESVTSKTNISNIKIMGNKSKQDIVPVRFDEEAKIRQDLEGIMNEDIDMTETSSQVILSVPELQATNQKLKKLGQHMDQQLHSLRDKTFFLEQELKRMAKGVEFALVRSHMGGASDTVSLLLLFYSFYSFSSFLFQVFLISGVFYSGLCSKFRSDLSSLK